MDSLGEAESTGSELHTCSLHVQMERKKENRIGAELLVQGTQQVVSTSTFSVFPSDPVLTSSISVGQHWQFVGKIIQSGSPPLPQQCKRAHKNCRMVFRGLAEFMLHCVNTELKLE